MCCDLCKKSPSRQFAKFVAKAGLVAGQSQPIMSWAQSNTANPWGQRLENNIRGICRSVFNKRMFCSLCAEHTMTKGKVTLGRKALHMRYMLRTFTLMVKSQSASSQSKMVPWCTNLYTAGKQTHSIAAH